MSDRFLFQKDFSIMQNSQVENIALQPCKDEEWTGVLHKHCCLSRVKFFLPSSHQVLIKQLLCAKQIVLDTPFPFGNWQSKRGKIGRAYIRVLSTSVHPQKELYEGREPTYLARGVRENVMAEVQPWKVDLDLSRGLLTAAIPRGKQQAKSSHQDGHRKASGWGDALDGKAGFLLSSHGKLGCIVWGKSK